MQQALARSHNNSVLSRPARSAPRNDRRGLAQTILRRLLSRPARTIAGAVLAAVLTGIVVNALVLQKQHRSGPLSGAPHATAETPRISTAPAPGAARPPVRPASLAVAAEPAPIPPSRTDDPIRDLLRGEAGKDSTHLTTAAQSDLIRLGYAIKADGVIGASTEQAIQQFERAHGLAVSNEITPQLVKLLSAAANAAAR